MTFTFKLYAVSMFSMSLAGGVFASGQTEPFAVPHFSAADAAQIGPANPNVRTCSWGAVAVSTCFPATASARCGRGYVCDTSRNFCCLPPSTRVPPAVVPPKKP